MIGHIIIIHNAGAMAEQFWKLAEVTMKKSRKVRF